MTRSRNLVEKFKQIDMFTQKVDLRFAGEDTKYRTRMGAFCSLLMYLCVLAIIIASLIVMCTKQRIHVNSHVEYGKIGEDFIFDTTDTDFSLAFALSEYPVADYTDLSSYG